MIDSYFRPPYQAVFVKPLLGQLSRLGVSPHIYTLASLFCGIGVAPALAFHRYWTAAAFLIISGYLDTLDGSVARAKGQSSPLGAVYDIVSDRIVETTVIIGLFLADPQARGLPCLLMLGSAFLCVTTFLVVGIFRQNEGSKSFHYSPGLMERAEAFLFFLAMILFPARFFPLAFLFAALVLLTALLRIWQFTRIYLYRSKLKT